MRNLKWDTLYMSRSLSKSELNYSTTKKECLAVIAAVQYFKHYLYGRTFTVYGDHEPLTWIDSIKDPMSRLNRWRARLRGSDNKFIYKPGKLNTNADALSRNPVPEVKLLFLRGYRIVMLQGKRTNRN